LPEADTDLIVPTAPRAARVGVRGSAPMRRGAAPYGNGCEQISGHSHLISLPIFEWIIGFEGGFLHNFLSRPQWHPGSRWIM